MNGCAHRALLIDQVRKCDEIKDVKRISTNMDMFGSAIDGFYIGATTYRHDGMGFVGR